MNDKEKKLMWQTVDVARAFGLSIPEPTFPEVQEWLAEVGLVASQLNTENSDPMARLTRETNKNVGITLEDEAESLVPYQTYKLWLIWTDLTFYNMYVDLYDPDMDVDGDLDQYPTNACYEFALTVLNNWVDYK
tara:strand:+ start:513 stop:914 length:402 start_codon:yes stop_codon:yes gene_type:complete